MAMLSDIVPLQTSRAFPPVEFYVELVHCLKGRGVPVARQKKTPQPARTSTTPGTPWTRPGNSPKIHLRPMKPGRGRAREDDSRASRFWLLCPAWSWGWHWRSLWEAAHRRRRAKTTAASSHQPPPQPAVAGQPRAGQPRDEAGRRASEGVKKSDAVASPAAPPKPEQRAAPVNTQQVAKQIAGDEVYRTAYVNVSVDHVVPGHARAANGSKPSGRAGGTFGEGVSAGPLFCVVSSSATHPAQFPRDVCTHLIYSGRSLPD
ncbi:hypothetical protein MTO96_010603 [Rhipicephalus appendiculatus]